ncbi:unnamed protein product, partial [Mycena citricolor]
TRGRKPFSLAAIGMYFIGLFAFLQVGAGIAQVIVSHQVRFYANLDSTKAITTLQGAASLACDLLITVYLCIFLKHQKTGVSKTNYMIDRLFYDAINRGTLTSLASAATIILVRACWFKPPPPPPLISCTSSWPSPTRSGSSSGWPRAANCT